MQLHPLNHGSSTRGPLGCIMRSAATFFNLRTYYKNFGITQAVRYTTYCYSPTCGPRKKPRVTGVTLRHTKAGDPCVKTNWLTVRHIIYILTASQVRFGSSVGCISCHDQGCLWFFKSLQLSYSNTIRTRPIPFEFFPIHHLFSIAPGTDVIK